MGAKGDPFDWHHLPRSRIIGEVSPEAILEAIQTQILGSYSGQRPRSPVGRENRVSSGRKVGHLAESFHEIGVCQSRQPFEEIRSVFASNDGRSGHPPVASVCGGRYRRIGVASTSIKSPTDSPPIPASRSSVGGGSARRMDLFPRIPATQTRFPCIRVTSVISSVRSLFQPKNEEKNPNLPDLHSSQFP